MTAPRFATELVGSWCKPRWLADHDRVYGPEGSWWLLPPESMAEALDDAVRLAVADQERAGLSYVGDGEQRRQTFSGHFYRIAGIDSEHLGQVTDFRSDVNEYLTMKARPAVAPVDPDAPPPRWEQPRVAGPLTWEGPILDLDTRFLQSLTDRPTKVTLIGPSSLALRLVDEHYGSLQDVAFALADVLNAEAKHLASLGVDLVQFDEPEVHFRHTQCHEFAAEALDRALHDVPTRTGVHMCYGYSKNIAEKRATPVYAEALALLASTSVDEISLEYAQPRHCPDLLEHAGAKTVTLGVLDLDTEAPVESVQDVLAVARPALEVLGPDRLRLAPDCGMWFLPRTTAIAKITAMEQAAQVLRGEHGD